jgi:hypothetical protein
MGVDRRDLLYLLFGAVSAALALVLLFDLTPAGQRGAHGVANFTDAVKSDVTARLVAPDAYMIRTGSDETFGMSGGKDGPRLVRPCNLPLNGRLNLHYDERTGTPVKIRPGGADERRLVLADLELRPVVWSEVRWQMAERRAGEVCPEGRVLITSKLAEPLRRTRAH